MAEALTKAIEMLAAAPQSPLSGSTAAPGQSQRDDVVRSVRRFEERVAQWRADMLIVQQGLALMYKSLSDLPDHTAFNDQMSKLDEFIDHVDKEIESERLDLERSKLSNRQHIAGMMKSSSDSAHFMRKILKRLYEAGVEQHNARVDFYHFLLAQRAECNPDYRGGPTFDNAEDLIADLHKHAR
jgi:hypothetical protein